MTLSYIEAYQQMRTGYISWGQYLDNLLARFDGDGHDDDDVDGMHYRLLKTDPFGYCLYCWSRRIVYKFGNVNQIKAVFESCHGGSLDEVRNSLSQLNQEQGLGAKKALATLALQNRRADVLKLCLDQGGFPFEGYFEDEANRVDEQQDPQTFRVLEQSRFRQLYPRRPAQAERHDDGADANDDDEDESDDDFDPADFDEGGSHPVNW